MTNESLNNSSEKTKNDPSSEKRSDVLKVGVSSKVKRDNLKVSVDKKLKPYLQKLLGPYAASTEHFIKGVVSGADKEGGFYSIVSSLANNLLFNEVENKTTSSLSSNSKNNLTTPKKTVVKTSDSIVNDPQKTEKPTKIIYENLKEGVNKLANHPKSIKEIAKFLGITIPVAEVFKLIVLNETGNYDIFSNKRFIRTTVTPKYNAGRTSTAYGPGKLTKGLANKYLTKLSHLFNSEEQEYLRKFVDQGNKMLNVKSKGGIYGYGGTGEAYFRTKKSKILYYQITLKMFDEHVRRNGGDFLKAAKEWRGDDLDKKYFKPIKKYQRENGNLKVSKTNDKKESTSPIKESNEKLPDLNKKILAVAKDMVAKGDKGDGKLSPIKRLKSEGSADYQKGKIKTSCWDWATEVFAKAGAKKKRVYFSKRNGQGGVFKKHVNEIKPGDYLIVHNGNRYLDGTHSVIFAGWENGKVGKRAISYSYSGGKKPPKKSTYDVSKGQIRGIFKPVPR